jgi:hypothetical protein
MIKMSLKKKEVAKALYKKRIQEWQSTVLKMLKNTIKCLPFNQISQLFIRINIKIIMWRLIFPIILFNWIKSNTLKIIKKKDSEEILKTQKLEFWKSKILKRVQNINTNKIKSWIYKNNKFLVMLNKTHQI